MLNCFGRLFVLWPDVHIYTYVVFHLSWISRLDVTRYSTRRNKGFIRWFSFFKIVFKRKKKKFCSFNNDYYANEYCIDIISFRLSIYIANANHFLEENFLAINNENKKNNLPNICTSWSSCSDVLLSRKYIYIRVWASLSTTKSEC